MPTNNPRKQQPPPLKAKKKPLTSAKKKANPGAVRVRNSSQTMALHGAPVVLALPKFASKFDALPGPRRNTMRIKATDYVGPLAVGDTITRGVPIATIAYSPSAIASSKLATMSTMFERFVVNSLRFHFASAVPTSVGGALIMGFDKDPEDQLQAGESGIRHLMGLSSVTQFASWEHASLDVRKENDQNFYFTSTGVNAEDDSRLVFTGLLSVIVMTPGNLGTGSQLGDLWVEADITFYDPTWEPMDRVSQALYLDSGPDDAILNNDDDGAWDELTPTAISNFTGVPIVSNSNQAFFERASAPDGHVHGSFRLSPGQWTISDAISALRSGDGGGTDPGFPTDPTLVAVPYGLDDHPVQNSTPVEIPPTVTIDTTAASTGGYRLNWGPVYNFVLSRAVSVLANGILSSLPILYWRIFQSFNSVGPVELPPNSSRSVQALWNGYLNAITSASLSTGVAYQTKSSTTGMAPAKPRVRKPLGSASKKPVISPGKVEIDPPVASPQRKVDPRRSGQ